MTDGESRRGFLKIATVAIGGVIGAVMAVPLVRYLFYPVGRRVVSSAGEPVDVGPSTAFKSGTAPVRVAIRAKAVRDAWSVTTDVALGAAWVIRAADGKLTAFSTTCPHLGCAVDLSPDQKEFRCPCHTSTFSLDGQKLGGPTKRGLDPLEVNEQEGRVLVTYKRFKPDVADREES